MSDEVLYFFSASLSFCLPRRAAVGGGAADAAGSVGGGGSGGGDRGKGSRGSFRGAAGGGGAGRGYGVGVAARAWILQARRAMGTTSGGEGWGGGRAEGMGDWPVCIARCWPAAAAATFAQPLRRKSPCKASGRKRNRVGEDEQRAAPPPPAFLPLSKRRRGSDSPDHFVRSPQPQPTSPAAAAERNSQPAARAVNASVRNIATATDTAAAAAVAAATHAAKLSVAEMPTVAVGGTSGGGGGGGGGGAGSGVRGGEEPAGERNGVVVLQREGGGPGVAPPVAVRGGGCVGVVHTPPGGAGGRPAPCAAGASSAAGRGGEGLSLPHRTRARGADMAADGGESGGGGFGMAVGRCGGCHISGGGGALRRAYSNTPNDAAAGPRPTTPTGFQ